MRIFSWQQSREGFFWCVCIFLVGIFALYQYASSATIVEYSDRLSQSGPATTSNHTISFRTTTEIPANGFIRFTPEPGMFTIPSSPSANFNFWNVALFVATSSGYVERSATSSPSATEDGIAITSGTSGSIEITLNSSVSIPANAEIELRIGNHTSFSTSTDIGIINPNATGTFSYTLTTGLGGATSEVTGRYAIIENISIADVDTRETDPPVRFNGAPTGTIPGTSVLVEISVETDEFSRCRYSSTPDTLYSLMGIELDTNFTTIHTDVISVLPETTYTYYVRCIDDEGNVNTDDYAITFEVLPVPEGEPGDDGDVQGDGEGTGDGDGDVSDGGGGTSTGDDSSTGSSGSGSGGGGGGGGGSSSGGDAGSGGFEGTDKPYQSGDARVIIKGFAFPKSTVVILVDGKVADEVTSGQDGAFSSTLDEIARGAYAFGVYAIDKNKVKSSTFSTTFTVTGSRGSTLSNINVMPSILVTPNPAEPNSQVVVSGYAIPDADITLEHQSDKTSVGLKTYTASSDANGAWSVTVPTTGLTVGTYKVRAKAKAKEEGGVGTNFSNYTFYGVGQTATVPKTSDLNRDSKVNLIDFSILLFWWNSDGGTSNPSADINQDGRVSLTDFSIMIFNWTG